MNYTQHLPIQIDALRRNSPSASGSPAATAALRALPSLSISVISALTAASVAAALLLAPICQRGIRVTRNIRESKAFTLAFATESTVIPCDYVGIVSGSSTADKVSKAGFTVTRSSRVNAPIFNELPLSMECTLVRIDGDEHIIGRIVNVSADESVIGEDGKPDYRLIRPLTYDPVHFDYVALGEKVGKAFSDGKKLK